MNNLPQLPGIYLIHCKLTHKSYIGSSHNIYVRVRAHINDLRKNKHRNTHLQRAWNKYGADAFDVEVLELCEKAQLLEREAYWFEQFGVGNKALMFNISTKPGAPMDGLKHKPETLVRLSKAHTGRKHSAETRIKIGASQKGRKLSPKQIAGIRERRKGRKASEETRAKLREIHKNPSVELRYKFGNAMRGKTRTFESVEKYILKRIQDFIITSPDGTEYHIKGLAGFCREHGLDQGSMSKVAAGKRKHHKGWHCKHDE